MAKPQSERLFRTGEIAKLLNVSGVTVRKYTNEFQHFLSPDARNETSRHFTPSDVQVLRLVRSRLNEGESYEQVRQFLSERQPLEGEVFTGEPEQEPHPEPPPSAIQPLEFFAQFVETLKAEHQSTLQAQAEHLETLKAENARLQAEVSYLRLSWFQRVFRKPPGAP